MPVPPSQLLLETLEDLVNDDYETFKFYLSMKDVQDWKPIPKSSLEAASRTATVRKMIESYGADTAVSVTARILRTMNCNSLATDLTSKYTSAGKEEHETAAPSTSAVAAPAVAAPAAAAMTAGQGGVIIAPTVTGGTSGSWNITIHK
ncbi:uncharacterized protein V6R79_019304 [Siganus canaliculatus]